MSGSDPAGEGTSSEGWQRWRAEVDLDAYDEQWRRMAASGENPHGEVDLVMRWPYPPATALDAGCGTGRVGIELARRGVEVVGVDLDADMVERARAKAPALEWHVADLASLDLGRTFDVVVLAGNVIPFVDPRDRADAIAACARHVGRMGRLIAGFSLRRDWFALADYDAWCADAGLGLLGRFATWDGARFTEGGDYAVSVHLPQ